MRATITDEATRLERIRRVRRESKRRAYAREPQRFRDHQRRYRVNNPEKIHARRAVAYAIQMHRLARPACCDACGIDCRPHAHHPDHSQPLSIRWLCHDCHWREHRSTH